MWKTATIFSAASAVLSKVLTDVLRSAVHSMRKSKDGPGGTQGIAMWGTFGGCVLLPGAAICGLAWLFTMQAASELIPAGMDLRNYSCLRATTDELMHSAS